MSEQLSEMSGYEVLSQAFVAEGVDNLFALLGRRKHVRGSHHGAELQVRVVPPSRAARLSWRTPMPATPARWAWRA